jgi:hypothetical protein
VRFTNNRDLPAVIRRAVENAAYDGPKASEWPQRISVTTLIAPPRIAALKAAHDETLTVDVADCLYMLRGQALHKILEMGAGPDDIIERRLETVVNGSVVSGQLDHLDLDGVLTDWKDSGSKWRPEWEYQLNCLDLLCYLRKLEVSRLQVCAFRSGEIEIIPVTRWERARQTAYMASRADLHQLAAAELPRCTDDETWSGRRCARWCQVASVCTQGKELSLDTGKKRATL